MVRGFALRTHRFVLTAILVAISVVPPSANGQDKTTKPATFKLPLPRLTSSISVEEAISKRRSVREYKDSSLSLAELSQLLWAAQGITDSTTYPGRALRAAPSAGALYPLEVYAVVGNVTGLAPGIYKYKCASHDLETISLGDARTELAGAAVGRGALTQAAVDIVWTAVYERCAKKYQERAELYVPIEVGHSAENVFLQATALNLGAVVMGAFYEDKVQAVLKSPKDERALYVMPIGRK
jgi:SagB-type dehydrogenase family enzyme